MFKLVTRNLLGCRVLTLCSSSKEESGPESEFLNSLGLFSHALSYQLQNFVNSGNLSMHVIQEEQ